MRSSPATVLLLILVALSVAGCGSGTAGDAPDAAASPTDSYDSERRAGVQDVLDRWADAVRSDDPIALADVMDERASPDFVAAELSRASNMSSVEFADFGYEIGTDPETPVPSAIAEPLAATDVWAPPVYLRYAVKGPDSRSTLRPVSLVVAERDGQWKLVSDADLPQYNRQTWRGPWDYGPVIVRSVATAGGTSVVLGHPGRADLVDTLAAELPSAIDAVSQFWSADWPRTVLVLAVESTDEFVDLAGPAAAGGDIAAITVSDAVKGDGTVPSGQRVVFGPTASDRLTQFTTRSVLRHELTHYAARADTVDGSPLWILEGFADYSGYRGSGAEFTTLAPTLSRVVASGGPPTVLPKDADFGAGGVRASLAYESAWSVFAYVAHTFGEPSVLDLYHRLAVGPGDESSVDAVIRSLFGIDTVDFIARWGAWTAQQSG